MTVLGNGGGLIMILVSVLLILVVVNGELAGKESRWEEEEAKFREMGVADLRTCRISDFLVASFRTCPLSLRHHLHPVSAPRGSVLERR